ncbi:uncharacterized protein AMSG_03265 [Thecamonas trahens ATCC 50062]|uniref:Plant heme peroxidase family profile domain-containing protein n=1 Tax=Thecamonas trahens ATCC 50062 TaxID=461836 RepID=A0A0L0D3F1_THETB|nr:hypothetical protein AMSG_03265 [Thecamonas trahens ATCC 50062]KNC46834.1 hypothetical protein AMSG_03265 [Thecamonas trahens ATCC 50062]|eukprot:XP_013760109.1 hypothetical protein AMSG_03265 [Thecamonas trahens ATCC 50062]
MKVYSLVVSVVVVLVLATCAQCGTVTVAQQALAIADVEALIAAQPARTAELVRLGFHDSVGVSPNHVSDGCINLENADNKGLINIVGAMENLYVNRQSKLEYGQMSRADFWALGGIVAARVGAANSAACTAGVCVPPMPLTYGRKDCATSPKTAAAGSFPNAQGGMSTVMNLFRNEMGFTDREVVALMGAHSLGAAEAADSGGFTGPWTRQPNTLDNEFYKEMVNSAWRQNARAVPGASPVHQWDSGAGGRPVMMLNTDMCLHRQIAPNTAGVSSCAADPNACPVAVTDRGVNTTVIVAEYAANNTRWALDFGPVYYKLVSMNTPGLVSAGEEVPNTVEPTTASAAAGLVPSAMVAVLVVVASMVVSLA